MGYLTAERAPYIGGLVRAGHELDVIFQEATAYGAVIRVGIDCEAVLPPERPERPVQHAAPERRSESQVPEQDFWPDEEWPD